MDRPESSSQGSFFADPEMEERSRLILEFERGWWKETGSKERAIRERFGISAARYHQLLNRLIDEPAALRYDPMLVRRLRRLRESRRAKRSGGLRGVEV